jgi:hypothetical protein
MTDLARAVRHGYVIVSEERGVELPGIRPRLNQDGISAEEQVHRALASQFGAIEFPRLMMEVDAQVRFSSTLLRRVPNNIGEVIAVYGALLAHGMGLDRVQVIRMMPSVSDSALRILMCAGGRGTARQS